MLVGWQSCAAVVVVGLVSVVVVVGEGHAVVVAVDNELCWSAAHSWPPLALGKAT